ncbi:hypothetical protein X727_31245 [Mesorhizobium sp. L103C119B0]|nr:hypothetical protein X727_31245 [Mesorhizobium sp. L103C119B0]
MAQDRQVVLTGFGGAYDKIVREYWLSPFEEATGIKVVVVPTANSAELRAKVQAKPVTSHGISSLTVKWTPRRRPTPSVRRTLTTSARSSRIEQICCPAPARHQASSGAEVRR